jgi:hypothetical protein
MISREIPSNDFLQVTQQVVKDECTHAWGPVHSTGLKGPGGAEINHGLPVRGCIRSQQATSRYGLFAKVKA